jgi:hypothetical protein
MLMHQDLELRKLRKMMTAGIIAMMLALALFLVYWGLLVWEDGGWLKQATWASLALLSGAGYGLIIKQLLRLEVRIHEREAALVQANPDRHWAVWRYSPEQWDRFAQEEHRYLNRAPWLAGSITFAAVLVGGGAAVLSQGRGGWAGMAFLLGFCLALSALVVALVYVNGQAQRKAYFGVSSPRIIITEEVFLVNGELTIRLSDKGYGLSVKGASVEEAHGMKVLRVKVAQEVRRGDMHTYKQIPVPEGQELEAQMLAMRFLTSSLPR